MSYAGYGIDQGFAAGQALFATGSPTAIFAANDNLAIGVMRAAYKAGRVVDADLSLVGCDHIPLAERLPVPLSTVHVPFDQIAASALDLLLADPAQDEIRRILPRLIPRASSGRL